MSISLPIVRMSESGKLIVDTVGQIGVPFCEDHVFWAMSGFLTVDMKADGKTYINGPFEMFEVAQVVAEAMLFNDEFLDKVESMIKQRKELKEKLEEVKKDVSE